MSRHPLRCFLFYCLLFSLLLACEGRRTTGESISQVTVTDDLGRQVRVPRHPQRVIGLAPSTTEMLYAVAEEKQIAGRTQVCDYPERVKSKPVVHTYPMDYEALVLLKPDLVVTVEGITSPEVAAKLEELHIPVYFQKFEKVTDVPERLEDLGRLLGREKAARQVADALRADLKREKVKPKGPRPRVLAVTWTDPIYVYGRNTLLTDKLAWIGAENAVTETFPQPYPALTREYILKINPDVILGGSFGKMDSTFFRLYPELRQVRAYRERKVFAIADNLMARPGPRILQAIRELKPLIR